MAVKRVFAGYYKRYDGKLIYVVRVVKDIDTGEAVVICKDASFIREGNEEYYTIRLESFCEQVNVDGILEDKYIRQTRREVEPEMIGEVTEDGFPEPKRKPPTYIDDEYQPRCVRRSCSYYEYAKDICTNYRMDLRRYKLIRERKQYIGVSGREAYARSDSSPGHILRNACRFSDRSRSGPRPRSEAGLVCTGTIGACPQSASFPRGLKSED